jgi:hypothetical protein
MNGKYCWHAVWSWEKWLSTKVVTKNMQSNRWPLNSWIFCRMHWAINQSTMGPTRVRNNDLYLYRTEEIMNNTALQNLTLLWSFFQNMGTFPHDYTMLHSGRQNSSVTVMSTSTYSYLVKIYCLLLTVISKHTKTDTFLNTVLGTVLTFNTILMRLLEIFNSKIFPWQFLHKCTTPLMK